MLILAADFYYLKNIAGRRLVGLRWWNEVDTATGDSHWVFESQDRSGGGGGAGDAGAGGGPVQNATDKRYVFFYIAELTGGGGIEGREEGDGGLVCLFVCLGEGGKEREGEGLDSRVGANLWWVC